MKFEQLQKTPNFEEIKKEIQEKILVAKENALDINKDEKFLQNYSKMLYEYFDTEIKDPNLETSSDRIRNAIANVQTLVEFRMLLESIGFSKDDVFDILEHENAHSNAQELEHENEEAKGYGVLFIRDEAGFHAQPHVAGEKKDSASMLEYLKGLARSVSAPERYGHSLSVNDVEDLAQYTYLIQKKEKERALE